MAFNKQSTDEGSLTLYGTMASPYFHPFFLTLSGESWIRVFKA
jgi:hypothetical protein